MRIHVIDTIEELEEYKGAWKEIFYSIGSDIVFSHPDWLMKWWRYHEKGRELFVLLLLDEEDVVGIVPLVKISRGLYKEICFLGEAKASYMDMLILHPFRQRGMDMVLDFLYNMKGNYIFNLKGLFIDDDFSILLEDYLYERDIPYYTYYLEVSYIQAKALDFEEYYKKRFSRSTIKTMRKKERRLNKLGEVSFELFHKTRHDIEDIFKLHDKRWTRKVGSSAFSRGSTKEFFKELALSEDKFDFNIPVYLILLNGKIIAFAYGFELGGRYTSYRVAHDDDFGMLSPGQILLKHEIKHCFEQGIDMFDFGVGSEPYKTAWTDEATYANTYIFPGKTFISKSIYRLFYMKLYLKKKIKEKDRLYTSIIKTLGHIKYAFSRENLAYASKKIRYWCTHIIRFPLSPIYTKSVHSMFRVELNRFVARYKRVDGYEVGEAWAADLSLMVEKSLLRPDRICRRFIKNDRCILVKDGEGATCYIWVATSPSSWVIYDYYMDTDYGKGHCYISYLIHALIYIRHMGVSVCYLNGKDLPSTALDRDIFKPLWTLEVYRFLFFKRYRIWSEF